MKKFAIISLLLLTACGVTHHLPPETEHTVVHYIDSIAWHDSTIIQYLTKERYVDITKPLDTLYLETSYAEAQAYLDTSMNVLKGSIENKYTPIETPIKWKEKISYKDSIQVKKIPYPVEVTKEITKYPKSYWWLLVFSIISALYFGVKTYLKFKLK